MYTNQKRKKYPSQIRYEENNPTISFRMKKHEKEKIRKMAEKSKMSISKLVRIALLEREEDFIKSYDQFYKKGYDEAFNDWAIWCYCYNCLKPIYINPDSEDHEKIIDQMKGRLKHDQCPG